jgi:hypothetical protein
MWSRIKGMVSGGAADDGQADHCLQQGIAHFHKGEIEQAAASFAEAARRRPAFPEAHNNLGLALRTLGDLRQAEQHFREAVRLAPDNLGAWVSLGDTLTELDDREGAEAALRRAAQLAPGDPAIAANLRALVAGKVQRWHFSMMNDTARNAAYERAIGQAVAGGRTVLEIGTGSGLLAMMAARAGAARVTTCEVVRPLAMKAEQIIARNGMADRIRVIPKLSDQLMVPVDLPERAQVLISEIVASDLVGEGMLPAVEDAKARLLTPDAILVPRAATVIGRLAGSPTIEAYLRVGLVSGLDLSPFNEFTPLTLEPSEFGVVLEARSDHFDIFDFDFRRDDAFPPQRRRIAVVCTASGICHGVEQWIRLQLSEDAVFENAPGTRGTGSGGHWQQTLHAFAEPVQVTKGQVLHLVAAHNRQNLLFYVERIEDAGDQPR